MQPIPIETADDPRVADFHHVPDPVRVRRLGLFVVEGRQAVRRLLRIPRYRVRALLVTRTALETLTDALSTGPTAGPVYVTTASLMRQIGGYDFHQGCLGLAERPASTTPAHLLKGDPLPGPLLVLERVGNPDNIGGLFRNAAAFGVSAVLLSPGCGDPLYRKSIRTSIGATLDLPCAVFEEWPRGLEVVRRRGYQLVALTPDGDTGVLDVYRPSPSATGVALMVGNEGDGLSLAARTLADVRVRIPVTPPVDSINVATAAAIALYHLRVSAGSAARIGSSSGDGR